MVSMNLKVVDNFLTLTRSGHFMKKINKQNIKGFTLLEILVVMVILGVLVTIGLRTFSTSQMRARDAKRKSDVGQIAKALELFYADHGYYPVHSAEGEIVVYENEDATTFEWGDIFYDPAQASTVYIGNLPKDPSGLSYAYRAYIYADGEWQEVEGEEQSEAKAYRIFARLENPQDGDITSGDIVEGIGCGSLGCNYFISSTNLPSVYPSSEESSSSDPIIGDCTVGDCGPIPDGDCIGTQDWRCVSSGNGCQWECVDTGVVYE